MMSKMKKSEKDYWFPAKRYGWGWGIPCKWQGWVVFLSYFVLLFSSIPLQPVCPAAWWFFFAALTIFFVAIAWLKGEPPKWRWGKGE